MCRWDLAAKCVRNGESHLSLILIAGLAAYILGYTVCIAQTKNWRTALSGAFTWTWSSVTGGYEAVNCKKDNIIPIPTKRFSWKTICNSWFMLTRTYLPRCPERNRTKFRWSPLESCHSCRYHICWRTPYLSVPLITLYIITVLCTNFCIIGSQFTVVTAEQLHIWPFFIQNVSRNA